MVNFQSPVTNRTEHYGPVSGFAVHAAGVASDVELAELQARLAKADAGVALERAKLPIVIVIVGSCLALASLPVLTLGLAALLDDVSGLNIWQSQLIVGSVAAVASLIMIYWAIRAAFRSLLQFQRSVEQLANNVAWFKSTLKPGTSSSSGSNGHR